MAEYTPPIASSSSDSKFWLPPPDATSSLSSIRSSLASFPSAPLRISRVAQLDAQLLDTELEGILHAPVKSALQGITARGSSSWEPELLALLRFTILKMSFWDTHSSTGRGSGNDSTSRKGGAGGDASYGSSLQNLRYRNESKHSKTGLQSTAVDSGLTRLQKILYISFVVLPPYLSSRLQDRMMTSSWSDEPLPRSWFSLINPTRALIGLRSRNFERREEEMIQWKREWKRSIWELLRASEKLANMAGLINFLVFLYNGRYRSLIDRILRMRLVYAQRTATPNVSFEYLNRQLVWEAFTEFLLFLMPLINLRRLRLRISKTLSSKTSQSKTLRAIATSLPSPLASTLGLSSLVSTSSDSKTNEKGAKATRKGKFDFLPPTTCPICYQLSNAPPLITQLPTSTISATSSSIADPTNPSSSLLSHHSTNDSSSSGPVITQDTSVKIPYVTNCEGGGCRYCYYCLVGVLVDCEERLEEGWECLRCGGLVTGCRKEEETTEAEQEEPKEGSDAEESESEEEREEEE
ncbi:pex2/pex10/pex12 family protein [Sporobolomyces salmoneus]|uniref:pex2/pex10/pex12 family protein n=1 Tax=Sporobolomyces salmoneus TaxID=183962 RepID=UPI003174D8B2